ncbi:MAG: hypothetical protein WC635_14515 [Bacteriovorax sp.]
MKSLIKISFLAAVFTLASCAHHKSCDMHGKGKESCKECCKDGQCKMKSETKEEPKK